MTCCLLAAALACLPGADAAVAAYASRATPLKVLAWAGSIDPDVAAHFEAEQGARLIIDAFESDDRRDAQLAERAGRGYDLIIVDSTQVARYARRGWLHRLDRFDLPNRAFDMPSAAGSRVAALNFGTPFSRGTLGIAWRDDLWPAGFDRWQQLLSPEASLDGRILMVSNARELVGVALKAAGHSANTSETLQIEAAGAQLAAQRPSVGYYGYAKLEASAPLVTGDVVAAMMYSGDALRLQALDPRIRYRVPREGGLQRTDFLAISAFAEYPELAARFIDFVNRPSIAARQARYLRSATLNVAARELLPASFLSDPIVYPEPAVLQASEFLLALPAPSQRLINAVGAQLMSR